MRIYFIELKYSTSIRGETYDIILLPKNYIPVSKEFVEPDDELFFITSDVSSLDIRS